jgi:aminoglycoside phosphotransferase (APT) family kinase protein
LLEKKTAMLEKIQYLSSEYSPTLVHNDIKGEHILVDPQSGRITGILDWADAGIGNPAVDIAGLVLTVGNDLAKRIAREVGYGENQILQGVLQARCECVLRLDDRLNGGDKLSPVGLLRDQLFLSLED